MPKVKPESPTEGAKSPFELALEHITERKVFLQVMVAAKNKIQATGRKAGVLIRDAGSFAVISIDSVRAEELKEAIVVPLPEFNKNPLEIVQNGYKGLGQLINAFKRAAAQANAEREMYAALYDSQIEVINRETEKPLIQSQLL